MKEVKNIFIVDDDPMQASMLQDYLSKYSTFDTKVFHSGEECMKNIALDPQIVFLDYNFDKAGKDAMNGTEILKKIKAASPETEVVMFSGQDKIEPCGEGAGSAVIRDDGRLRADSEAGQRAREYSRVGKRVPSRHARDDRAGQVLVDMGVHRTRNTVRIVFPTALPQDRPKRTGNRPRGPLRRAPDLHAG